MIAARQQAEAEIGLLHGLGLGQDAAADGNDGVGGEHQRIAGDARGLGLVLGGDRLLIGEALRELARQLVALRRLVDVGRHQMLGLDADLVEQREAPRGRRGKDEFGTCRHGYRSSGTAAACEPPAMSVPSRSRTRFCRVSRSVR